MCKKGIANNSISIKQMTEELRNNHIDILLIIKEELMQIIPQYIEEIIQNIYQAKVLEVK